MNMMLAIAAAWLVAAAFMVWLWSYAEKSRDAGVVDVAWAALAGLFAVWFAANGGGSPGRRILLGAMGLLWGIRLAVFLYRRVRSMPEDGRYSRLRASWASHASRNFFIFFQAQASWSVLFPLPVLVAAGAVAPLGPMDAIGFLIWLIAVTGESVADRQLSAFRQNPRNRNGVCRGGLWRYSRHPNYFFEWLHWWGYVLIGWSAPYGWLTLLGPVVMLVFLFKITGIPPTEENALASRGEAYREYQRTTSVFFPLPPRKSA